MGDLCDLKLYRSLAPLLLCSFKRVPSIDLSMLFLTELLPLPPHPFARPPLAIKSSNTTAFQPPGNMVPRTTSSIPIDPALLDEDELEAMEIPDSTLQAITDLILPGQAPGGSEQPVGIDASSLVFTLADARRFGKDANINDEADEDATVIFDDLDDASTPTGLSSEAFIAAYASINIVRNRRGSIRLPLLKPSSKPSVPNFEVYAADVCATGGSRDPPSQFIEYFLCRRTQGCSFIAAI